MKTKIGLPFGLALVVFIGIFTTMLALGALNPQPAEAAFAAPDLKIDTSDDATYARADWTFTVKNDADAIDTNGGNDNDVVIVFPDGFVLTDADAIENEDNWSVKITVAGDTTQAAMDRVGSTVDLEEVTLSNQTITVNLISSTPPEGEVTVNARETIEIKFTAPKRAGFPTGGIINPDTATADVDITVDGNSVFAAATTERIDIVGKPANVTVSNDPDDPGHEGAGYRIDCNSSDLGGSEQLTAGGERI